MKQNQYDAKIKIINESIGNSIYWKGFSKVPKKQKDKGCPHADYCTQDKPTKPGTVPLSFISYIFTGVAILLSQETAGLFLAIFTFALSAFWDFLSFGNFKASTENDHKRRLPNYIGIGISGFWSLASFFALSQDSLIIKTNGGRRFLVIQSNTLLMNGVHLELPIAILNLSVLVIIVIIAWDTLASKTTSSPKQLHRKEDQPKPPSISF